MRMRSVVTASVISLVSLFSAQFAMAKDCNVTVEGSDAMQYNTKEIKMVCPVMKITLKHAGKLPKAAMGHNLVIAKTADMQDIVAKGGTSGADKDFVPAGDKRIIAHTKLLSGGESDTISVKLADLKKGEKYSFFCTFPGHSAIMNGTVSGN